MFIPIISWQQISKPRKTSTLLIIHRVLVCRCLNIATELFFVHLTIWRSNTVCLSVYNWFLLTCLLEQNCRGVQSDSQQDPWQPPGRVSSPSPGPSPRKNCSSIPHPRKRPAVVVCCGTCQTPSPKLWTTPLLFYLPVLLLGTLFLKPFSPSSHIFSCCSTHLKTFRPERNFGRQRLMIGLSWCTSREGRPWVLVSRNPCTFSFPEDVLGQFSCTSAKLMCRI